MLNGNNSNILNERLSPEKFRFTKAQVFLKDWFLSSREDQQSLRDSEL